MVEPATDVHQHLWPEGLVEALARRRREPCVRRDGRGWRVRLAGEADSEALPEDEARPLPAAWHAGVRDAGDGFGLPSGGDEQTSARSRPAARAERRRGPWSCVAVANALLGCARWGPTRSARRASGADRDRRRDRTRRDGDRLID